MTCPNCGAILDERSLFCNHCGQAQQTQQAQSPPPPPGCEYQKATGDQEPRPVFRNTDGAPFGGERIYLILSICCFSWAGLVGLPRAIRFLVMLLQWSWSVYSWPPFSSWFSVAVYFVLPLVGAFVLLERYRRSNNA